ncbi:hypothetical protein [Candidatus Oleimmundimicrobium sp.]|uniref:hypothetical protein n=1 Tax=Candidatus Oleimmundimicrobium sp. TaxID=3060597 RepID=UPI00271E7BA9|nr:hypothetical protein [Candidatus Oleimmundimicrobium sp.]MDO8885724.1 hypothetical protein [Candidatus Oleimmundimicrobium sp.]
MNKADIVEETITTQSGKILTISKKCKMWLKDSWVEIPLTDRKKYKKADGNGLSSYPYIALISFGIQHQIAVPDEGIYSAIDLYRQKGFIPLSETPKEVQEAFAIAEKVHKAEPLYKTSYLKHKEVENVDNKTTE